MTVFSRIFGADLTPAIRARVMIGLGASLLVAITSWGSAAVLMPYMGPLAPGLGLTSRTGGSPIAASLTLLGLAILLWVWWDLRDRGLTAHTWLRIAAVWALPLLLAAPLQSRDVYSYAAQGQLLNEGLSPYEHAVRDMSSDWVKHTSSVWLASPSPYGPFFMLLARGFAYVSGGNIIVALALFRALALASIVVTAWAVLAIGRRLGLVETRLATVAWLAVANPFVLSQAIAGSHNDAISAALIAVALLWAWDGRLPEASMLVAAAGMVKVTAIIALPFVALVWVLACARPAFRVIVRALFSSVGYALISMVLLSLGLGLGFAWVIPVDGLESGVSPSFSSGFGILFGSVGHILGLGDALVMPAVLTTQKLALMLMMVALVVTFLVVAARAVVDTARGLSLEHRIHTVIVGLAIGLASTAVLAPTIRGWYVLWFLPFAALALRTRRNVTILALTTAFLTLLVQPDGSSVGVAGPHLLLALPAIAIAIVILREWIYWVRAEAPSRADIEAGFAAAEATLAPTR